MKRCCTVFMAFILGFCLCAVAEAGQPETYRDFKAMYQDEGRTPEGAVRMHFQAIFCYMDPAKRAEASKMLRYSMHLPEPLEQNRNMGTFLRRLKEPSLHHIFRSYCKGSAPSNNYAMNPDSFSLSFAGKRPESDYLKVFLHSSGADSPRPVWVKQYDGLWYTINNSSIYLKVREPKSAGDSRRNAHDADYD